MFKTHRTYDLTNGVKNNTIAVLVNKNRVSVIYHKTTVVSVTDKYITLNTDGWQTVSSRIVINRALENLGLSSRIVSVKGQWTIDNKPYKDGFKLKR